MYQFDCENIDADIDKVLQEQQITTDNALNMLFDSNNTYGELLEQMVTDLRNQTGNKALFINSIKCAAHN